MDSYSLYPEAFPLVAETLEYRVSVSWISHVPFSISISCSQWVLRLVQRYLGSLNCHPLCSIDNFIRNIKTFLFQASLHACYTALTATVSFGALPANGFL
jgi:hypothetical protein